MGKIEGANYNVWVNEDNQILVDFIENLKPSKVFIIVDENTKKHCLPILEKIIDRQYYPIEIHSGEIHKTLQTSESLWEALINYQADRSSLIINLGGGVIGDMGGFVAASYMRGIPFIQIPTTLLSQVDASIGGKLGIDFKNYKNLVGLFQNPNMVWVNTQFLKTLDPRELKSGFAEVLKHGLIQSKTLWDKVKNKSLNFSDADWDNIVFESIQIKNNVVSQDPTEQGLRKILNFGHTIGHAIESFYLGTDKQLLHGEAIAIGMICEAYLSYKENLISKEALQEIQDAIKNVFHFEKGLKIATPQIIDNMSKDKKNRDGKILFSLLEGIGKCTFNKSIQKSAILDALNYFEQI